MRQCGYQHQRADHVPDEHEGEQDAHVGLELDRRPGPGDDAGGQRDADQRDDLAGELDRLGVRRGEGQAAALLGELHREQVQRVVDADAHPQRDHRQRGHLDADAEHDHQRLAQHRGDHQRHHRDDDRPPAAEGDEAQHDHREIDVDQHLAPRLLDDDVGRRLDAGAAGGEQERAAVVAVLIRERLGRLHDPVERLGLVVGQVGDHRHHRAIGVEQIRVVDRGLLRRVVQHVLVAVDRQPLRVALERAGGDLARRIGQRHRRLHAGHLPQRPGQPVGLDQRRVLEAALRLGLDDDGELVRRQRVVGGDVGVVEVVARVGPQLGRAGVEVADLELGADGEARRPSSRPPPRSRRSPSGAT